MERLHKVIAKAGLTSRREAERWIRDGRIRVNGDVVTSQGLKVDPERDIIEIDGEPLKEKKHLYYYIFYKPKNVLVARTDPRKRPVIYDYLNDLPTLLHPVGRLDFDSEGLVLLTNDGDLNYRFTHPSKEVPKTYHVKVRGHMDTKTKQKFLKGIELEDGLAKANSIEVIRVNPHNSWVQIVVTEGRNRLIRRMCETLGHPVLRLVRVAIGDLKLGNLKAGEYRPLTRSEESRCNF